MKIENYKDLLFAIFNTEEYLPIAKARIEYVCNLDKLNLENLLKIEEKETKQQSDKQITLFDLVEVGDNT